MIISAQVLSVHIVREWRLVWQHIGWVPVPYRKSVHGYAEAVRRIITGYDEGVVERVCAGVESDDGHGGRAAFNNNRKRATGKARYVHKVSLVLVLRRDGNALPLLDRCVQLLQW